MKFKELKNIDLITLTKLKEVEDEAFGGEGGADFWILKALVNYGKVFVLEEKEEIVTILEYMKDFSNESVFIYGLCTAKKYRNQGCAQKILELGEKYLKNNGIKEIKLTVDPKNIKAIELYKKQGYAIVELCQNEYGLGIDRYLMKKVII